jgi:REP element-mobilizing transposase RayT
MKKYDPNIHHRKSIRLKDYDYSQAGLYFITICCHNRICRFGHVQNGEMVLNEYGTIAFNEWINTTEIRKNVELGEFVIMPNHMHGIVKILERGRGELHSPDTPNELHSADNLSELQLADKNTGECNSPLRGPSQTIGAIVRGYKSSVTKQLGLLGFTEKLWQRNYWDNIIRDEKSYDTISNYIKKNPAKWSDDRFFQQ